MEPDSSIYPLLQLLYVIVHATIIMSVLQLTWTRRLSKSLMMSFAFLALYFLVNQYARMEATQCLDRLKAGTSELSEDVYFANYGSCTCKIQFGENSLISDKEFWFNFLRRRIGPMFEGLYSVWLGGKNELYFDAFITCRHSWAGVLSLIARAI